MWNYWACARYPSKKESPSQLQKSEETLQMPQHTKEEKPLRSANNKAQVAVNVTRSGEDNNTKVAVKNKNEATQHVRLEDFGKQSDSLLDEDQRCKMTGDGMARKSHPKATILLRCKNGNWEE